MTTQKKKKSYLYATGRRKTSTARVRFIQIEHSTHPEGSVVVNEKDISAFFPAAYVDVIKKPIELVAQKLGGYFSVKVNGGGAHSQAQAIRHGIARILVQINADWKAILKTRNFITRDSRMKERKKPGLRRARRSPQWSKR